MKVYLYLGVILLSLPIAASSQGVEQTLRTARHASEPDRFLDHGSLRVSESGRHLEHEDGTPFFYFGDTAWEICWKSRREEAIAYLDDRAAKGFTVIQIVAMSHQRFRFGGVINRYDEAFFDEGDKRTPNPGYFEYVDWLVDEMNSRGMVAAIVPLWAYMSDVHLGSGPVWQRPVTQEEAFILAEFLGGRYSDKEIIWILGGDNSYNTPEQKEFWRRFAATLDDAAGRDILKTIHPRGWSASFDYFDNETDWLDFQCYQSSHIANGEYTWKAGERGYDLRPIKPNLNAEAVYEDIYHHLWEPGDTTSVETFRIRDIHVRRALIESVFSGATMGMVYGANGVWQWSTEEFPGSHAAQYRALQAMEFPGSTQAGFLKTLFLEMGWPQIRPAQDLIRWRDGNSYVPAARFEGGVLAYLPEEVRSVGFRYDESTREGFWIDVAGGEVVDASPTPLIDGSVVYIKPEGWQDALWITKRVPLLDMEDEVFEQRVSVYPNPSRSFRVLDLQLDHHAEVKLEVVDVLGRRAHVDQVRLPVGQHTMKLPDTGRGMYFFRLMVRQTTGEIEELTGSYVVLPK